MYDQIKASTKYGINNIQTVLNYYSRQSLEFVIPFCKTNNLNVIARMPLAKGLLSGKYKIGHKFNKNDKRSNNLEFTNSVLSEKISSPEEAINWCKFHVSEIIIGSKNYNQIKSNFNLINY